MSQPKFLGILTRHELGKPAPWCIRYTLLLFMLGAPSTCAQCNTGAPKVLYHDLTSHHVNSTVRVAFSYMCSAQARTPRSTLLSVCQSRRQSRCQCRPTHHALCRRPTLFVGLFLGLLCDVGLPHQQRSAATDSACAGPPTRVALCGTLRATAVAGLRTGDCRSRTTRRATDNLSFGIFR